MERLKTIEGPGKSIKLTNKALWHHIRADESGGNCLLEIQKDQIVSILKWFPGKQVGRSKSCKTRVCTEVMARASVSTQASGTFLDSKSN